MFWGPALPAASNTSANYLNIFPMLSAAYNPSSKSLVQMSFNHPYQPPDYGSFNPYKFYVNPRFL